MNKKQMLRELSELIYHTKNYDPEFPISDLTFKKAKDYIKEMDFDLYNITDFFIENDYNGGIIIFLYFNDDDSEAKIFIDDDQLVHIDFKNSNGEEFEGVDYEDIVGLL